MYLVELRPGKEELYRTSDDLAAAIRRGDVDVHSRIYHRATSKWISVTLHPQYKAIVAQKAAEPLPPMDRSDWTYLNAQSETLEGSDPQPDDAADPESGGAPPVEGVRQPWRRLFALGVAGLALLLGMQLAFSGQRPPWAQENKGRTPALPASHEQDEPADDEQVISLASTSTGWNEEADAAESRSAAAEKPAGLPRAPTLRLKTLGEVLPAAGKKTSDTASPASVEGLLERYAAAHEAALARLGSGVRVARLGQLLASSRLTPDGGVTETRLGLAGVANFIRIYRQQEELIEQEYQDTFSVMAREQAWSTKSLRQWQNRPSPKESPALVKLTSNLLLSIDSVLGLLTEEAGAYRLGEGTIAFEDPEASRRYARLRRHVSAAIDSARVAGGDESTGPIAHVLQAIGTTRLPKDI
jgi:hypothetical protein